MTEKTLLAATHLPAPWENKLKALALGEFISPQEIYSGSGPTGPIIFFCSDHDPAWREKTEFLKQRSDFASVVFLVNTLNTSLVNTALSTGFVDYFALPDQTDEQLSTLISQALEKSSYLFLKEGQIRSSSKKIKEFEVLQQTLERMVEERTFHIQASQEEEEKRLQKVRALARWIRDLSTSASLEDVLVLLKAEMRPLHSISDACLAVELVSGQTDLHFLPRGQIASQNVDVHLFESVPDGSHLEVKWSQKFADILGRPVGKLMAISIDIPLIRKLGFPHARAFLIIENSFSPRELKSFNGEWDERMQSLAITVDRILLESELTRYSYRWEKTFDGLMEPLAIIDSTDLVVRSNLAFSDRKKRGHCFEIFQERKERCVGCPIPEVIASKTAQKGEVKKGNRTYEVHSYPIYLGRRDTPSNFVSLYVDVTNKRELTQKYIQAEKMSALGLLAGHIAHELNNPLTGLRSMAQLLAKESDVGSQVHADLLEIEKAAARSEKTIRHLIEFVDMEGKDVDWISLDEIVERTLPLLKMTTRGHQVHLQLSAHQRKIRVHGHLLQQVVFNLVTNACQAMDKSGELTIKTQEDEIQKKLFLVIQDTGSGIPKEIQARIFEPFFTTKPEGLGTGLGLSLSREIVERFGGRIELSSEVGQGTQFTISFPFEGVS